MEENKNREICLGANEVRVVGRDEKCGQVEVVLEFKEGEDVLSPAERVAGAFIDYFDQIKEDQEVIRAIMETPLLHRGFETRFIEFLEEKFGLKVKFCCNCEYWEVGGSCRNYRQRRSGGVSAVSFCEEWSLKEKKERMHPAREAHLRNSQRFCPRCR